MGPFPPSEKGNRYLITFCDSLTRWWEYFPVPSAEASVVARLLVNEITVRHGAPRTLLSHRGTNFLSKIVAEVCKICQIHKVSTSSYHPQTDGLVERLNSTLCQSLSLYIACNQKDWDEFIPLILFAHRPSVCEAIGDTPFYCLYAASVVYRSVFKLLSPADENLTTSALQYRKRIVENIELASNAVRENTQRAQQRLKEYYDRNAKDPEFEVGQRFWVYTPRTKQGLSKKLLHSWLGPHRII